MVLTESSMLQLGSVAPDFTLTNVLSGESVSRDDFSDKKALLVIFMCQHCPYVKHIEDEIAQIGKNYENKDLGIVAVSSNDVSTHPDDSPEKLKEQAERLEFTFPYLYDESQEVAKAYTAACTPDPFLFRNEDGEFKLVYRGQLDGSRPGNGTPVSGKDIRNAIDAVLSDNPIQSDQKPSSGCNIKWKSGNEPDYL